MSIEHNSVGGNAAAMHGPTYRTVANAAALALLVPSAQDIAQRKVILQTDTGDLWQVCPGPTYKKLALIGFRKTLFVDPSSSSILEDGTASHPYKTIQAAINVCPSPVPGFFTYDPTQIIIASGIYAENLTVSVNQQIFLSAWTEVSNNNVGGGFSVLVNGNLTWNVSGGGASSSSGLFLKGIVIAGNFVINSVAPATGPIFKAMNSQVTGNISRTGAFASFLFTDDFNVGGTTNLPEALCLAKASSFGGNTTFDGFFGNDSSVNGILSLTTSCLLINMTINELVTASGCVVQIDQFSSYSLASSGGLNTPSTVGTNNWKPTTNAYGMCHVVRQETANFTVNIGDETIVADPNNANLNCTLCPASLYAESVDYTNDGIARRSARHLIIKNADTGGGDGTITLIPDGTDLVEDGDTILVRSGEELKLTPVLISGVWHWMLPKRFGLNLFVLTNGGGNTTNAAYQDVISFTTPALKGIYRFTWRAIVSVSVNDTDVQTRLFDSTASFPYGTTKFGFDTQTEDVHGGIAYIAFVGSAKTIKLQFRRNVGTGNAVISDCVVEMVRFQ